MLKAPKSLIKKAKKMAFGSISDDAKGIAARKRIGIGGGGKKAYGPNVEPDVIFNGATPGGGLEEIAAANRLKGSMNIFSTNLKKTDGGWKAIAGKAGVGAIGGGLAGAGINTMTGQDAWEGAKTGATFGALGYGGLHAMRTGVGAKTGESLATGLDRFNTQRGVSKDVTTIMKGRKAAAIARKEVLEKKRRG